MSELKELFTESKNFEAEQEIIKKLLDDSNLETKTELDKPLRFSCLRVLKKLLENHNMKKSSTILEDFMIESFRFLISHEREGRKEIIKALQSLTQINQENQKVQPLNPIQKQMR